MLLHAYNPRNGKVEKSTSQGLLASKGHPLSLLQFFEYMGNKITLIRVKEWAPTPTSMMTHNEAKPKCPSRVQSLETKPLTPLLSFHYLA